MIERTYKCNLCRDRKEPNELIGLHHEWDKWVEKESVGCENHICFSCLQALTAIFNQRNK